jgi:hypothetical protein
MDREFFGLPSRTGLERNEFKLPRPASKKTLGHQILTHNRYSDGNQRIRLN